MYDEAMLTPHEKVEVFAAYASDVVNLLVHRITHGCDSRPFSMSKKDLDSVEEAHFTQLLVYIRPLALLKSEFIHIAKVANAISELSPSSAPRCREIRKKLTSIENSAKKDFRVITDSDANTLWAGTAYDLLNVYLHGRLLHANASQVRQWQGFDRSVQIYAVGHANSYVLDHANVVCETLRLIRELKLLR
ncbi:hypothetical protein [Arthrobacter flavus]|uniref:Uncharacterized protein n=1 Tax=Arthrobacter flavus TaxID=95172 RepID=A0ABW4QA82_9MICC